MKITVKMSERRPVTIDTEDWSLVTSAEHEDDRITVRQRGYKGDYLVYVTSNGEGQGGFLVPSGARDADLVRAIRRCAGLVQDMCLADECVENLPAEEI